jgi:tungstate transport system substrate-binding protein
MEMGCRIVKIPLLGIQSLVRLKLGIIGAAVSAIALALSPTRAAAQEAARSRDIVLATTTSLKDTGLLDSLLPIFERESGYHVRAVGVGSGQALKLGERGDADVVLAHSPAAENAFMRAGHGVARRVVAWNYFVLAGPQDDPAKAGAAPSASEALRRIAAAGRTFVSRGDSSGTHQRELELWRQAGGRPRWHGYVESGQGMGPTLLVADERRGYTLSDAGTLAAFRDRIDLVALRGQEAALRNVYHVIEIQPEGRPRMNAAGGRAFAEWITSPRGQQLIAAFHASGPGAPYFVAAHGVEPAP